MIVSGCGAKIEPLSASSSTDTYVLAGVQPRTAPTSSGGPPVDCEAIASPLAGSSAPGIVTAYTLSVLLESARILAISANSGKSGSSITLTGNHFYSNMQVTFCSIATTPIQCNDTFATGNFVHQASITVPSLTAGVYSLSVTQDGNVVPSGTTAPLTYTVTP
jgi:hypothetical protein